MNPERSGAATPGPRTQIASHRGGALLWPENSMTAFRNTARLPVDQVEFDVHPTRDGHLVVHHDPTLDRMTDGEGPIAARTFDELSALTIKGTESDRIPLLSEVLGLFQPTDLTMRLEIKGDADKQRYDGLEARIAAALRENAMFERTVLTSFLPDVLDIIAEIEPDMPVIWLVRSAASGRQGDIAPVIDLAREHGFADIGLHADDLWSSEMEAVTSAGLGLGAYATYDEPAMRRMFDLGVTVFTTDRPDLALKVRDELSAAWAGS